MSRDEQLFVVTRHAFHEEQLIEVAEIAYPAFHTRITHTVILDRPDLYHREARQSR